MKSIDEGKDLDKVRLPEFTYNEYDLAVEVCGIFERSQNVKKLGGLIGGIENMEILQLIIDYQFESTKKFVKAQIVLYSLGYFLPLIIQM